MREAEPEHEVIGETDEAMAQNVQVSGAKYGNAAQIVNSPDRAMKVAAVFRAVDLISSGVGVLTMKYKRKNRAKNYYQVNDTGEGKTINYLLSTRPNKRHNSYTFFKYLVSNIILHGNAFVLPVRDGSYRVKELVLLDPMSVAYDILNNTYSVADTFNGVYGTYHADEILHFKNFCSNNGYWGQSTIHYAAVTLGIAATSDRETLDRFATGGRVKGILRNNQLTQGVGEYQDNQMQAMADDIMERSRLGDDILVVRGDAEFTQMSMSSADMQFLESRKFTIREIARFFNVPASKLMDDTNSNYKSTEMSNIAFYSEALQPIVTEIEREFNAKMLSVETFMDYKYKYDISALNALDLNSKKNWNQGRLNTGQATVNDLRREEDLEPVEGGDEVYLSVNLAPLGSEKLNGGSGNVTNNEEE